MKKLSLIVVALFVSTTSAFAAPPLVVQDTTTAGKGVTEVEVRGEYGYSKASKNNLNAVGTEIRFGVLENLNVEVAYDRSFGKIADQWDFIGTSTVQLRAKYRLPITEQLSLSVAPRYTYQYTADTRAGSSVYGVNGAVQYDMKFASVFGNASYDYFNWYSTTYENNLRNSQFTYGVGTKVPLFAGLSVVGQYYSATSLQKGDSMYPAYAGGGLQYAYKMIELGVGGDAGLNENAQDYIIRSGLTLKF
jgi:hypothetical protein